VGECVLACNDARMGEVYWGVYRREADGSMTELAPEAVSSPDRVGADAPTARHVAGNALPRYPQLAARLVAAGLRVHEGLYPRADAVARLGALGLAGGRGVPAEEALPVYVRDDVARPAAQTVTEVS
jgi:tRNA threonylcarbamoyladenosine biosynthesis protein TsaB